MPKASPEPDPNQRRTRSKNAFAHPGRVIKEVLAVRRKPEEIEKEKKERNERQEAKAKKDAHKKAAVKDIAQFEHQMALDDKEQEARFPRHETEEAQDKRCDQSAKAADATGPSEAQKRKKKVIQPPENGADTELEDSETERYSKSKKQKIGEVMPLRRTETYLTPDDFKHPPIAILDDSTPKPAQKKKRAVTKALSIEDIDSEVESEGNVVGFEADGEGFNADKEGFNADKEGFKYSEEESEANVEGSEANEEEFNADEEEFDGDEEESDNDGVESEDEDFVTPKALRKGRMIPSKSDFSDTSSAEVGGTNMRNQAQESDHMQPEKRMKSGKMNQSKSYLGRDLQTPKRIDLSKAQRNETQSKKERAFRKEVEKRRVVVTKETANKGSHGDTLVGGQKTVSKRAAQSETYKVTGSRNGPRAQIVTQKKISKHALPQARSFGSSGLNQQSRNSATLGNKVSVTQSTHTVTSRRPHSNSKAGGLEEAAVNLSDEDDSTEREAISKSPPKGMKRLSSEAIVKVKKPASKTRTRSKKAILGQEILVRWSQYIEPNLFHCFFYELSPWPPTTDLVACAQNLWDWRFGDSDPLDFATNPRHLALLNQKLCEIRNGIASIAIANVDLEFRLANKIDQADGMTPDEEMEDLRQAYAADLLEDKKFVFGKYVVAHDGKVRKSQPYRSGLLLRTFQYGFKYLKDVNQDAPFKPESHYPTTLLAISAAAVERALTLIVDYNYDFELRKLIPKPDPSHPSRKPTTALFAFSETTWEPRTMVYLEKSISKLKEKDWKMILEAASEYSNISKTQKSVVLLKEKGRAVTTKEEVELAWDSDSDLD